MKTVSVIIPVYNCGDYIKDCLDSVINQTYSNNYIEVIMINDGTKDNSDKICKRYAKANNWIFIDRKKNLGLAYTRNEGIKSSSGEYLMFLDSDDILYNDAIENLVNKLYDSDSDMVISKLNSFNSKGEYGYYSDKYLKKEQYTNIYKNKKLLNCVSVCAKLYKRSALKNIYFLEGTVHEDNSFTLKMLLNSKRIVILPIYTYYRRIRENENKSIMQNLNNKTFNDLLINFKDVIKSRKNNRKEYFLYKFMLIKSINYIIMNVSKIYHKECIAEFDNFMLSLYKGKKINKLLYFYYKIKYYIYYHLARIYKETRSYDV